MKKPTPKRGRKPKGIKKRDGNINIRCNDVFTKELNKTIKHIAAAKKVKKVSQADAILTALLHYNTYLDTTPIPFPT